MPATEQTWRDNKFMHVVFGISSLAMLAATIWMLVADYDREWKGYQRQFLYKVEPWVTQARLDAEQSQHYEQTRNELASKLQSERAVVPPKALVDEFKAKVLAALPVSKPAVWRSEEAPDFSKLDELDEALRSLENTDHTQDQLIAGREALLEYMQDRFIRTARFIEDDVFRRLKFRRADLAVLTSNYSIAVDESATPEQLADLQTEINKVRGDATDPEDFKAGKSVATLNAQYEDASTLRKELEEIMGRIRQKELAGKKALDDHDAEVDRLKKLAEYQARTSKRALEFFPLDAFNSPLKIDTIWLPKLTQNNNFRDVARFDHCTTCHRGIDVSAPGSATEPGYKPILNLAIALPTPQSPPAKEKDAADNELPISTDQVYGLKLAKAGLLNPDEVTIEVARPRSPAASAQLIAGDVITFINDVKVTSRDVAETYLLKSVKWGQPLQLKIRRGVPQPFSSHPRLDLYVGSLSPHKMGQVGCTICHEGQGSGTSFKWASHTPNTVAEADRWMKERGWFDNHHWIFPMMPKRFAESSCLKCHHEVVDLEPSERFPDPPAPKLIEGYNLIRQYGCFGCHEINGFDGPARRIGPDMRAEPNYTFAAQQLLFDAGLALLPRAKSLAEQVIADPTNNSARRQLIQIIESDARRAGESEADKPQLATESHKLAAVLADQDTPGQFRKVGPSLRHVASKVEFKFLYNWIRKPSDFRPTTRMPQFFELHDHFVPMPKPEKGKPVSVLHKHAAPASESPSSESPGLHESQKFEPVEIRAVTEYLLSISQPFKYVDPSTEATVDSSAARGKELFQMRGCLACHTHKDFPAGKATHGPDLSQVGDKFSGKQGKSWLYTWLRQPDHYHARTLMPDTFLLPIEEKDKEGKVTQVTDPAADIVEFLLLSRGWQPRETPARGAMPEGELKALYDLALQHLAAAYPKKRAEKYLRDGIPASERSNIKGDEIVLLGELDDSNRNEKQLHYVGRRTLTKYGCSGCHDIPGFENAKPIGTALADWGRKDPAKLAFEQIAQYMLQTHGTGKFDPRAHEHAAHGEPAEETHDLPYRDMEPSVGYLLEKLMHHQREGFIWQKLRAPRSYDYMKTENKSYNDRLRMPKFPFDQHQIEAIMTFVLGLVSEPPAAQYVYNPPPREKAIMEGNKLLDKYNCAGCHTLQMDRYEFDFDPKHSQFAEKHPFPETEYPIFRPFFTEKQIRESRQLDRRGLGHASITGQVVLTDDNGSIYEQDDDDKEGRVGRMYTPWQNTLIHGDAWLANERVFVPNEWITKVRPAVGGDLSRLLLPVAFAKGKAEIPNAKFPDARGWLPPPLVGEGRKVQSDWLHDFLLDPYLIRPAVFLRMPGFNMSSVEASKLANFFAAIDRADYPYEFDARTSDSHLAQEEHRFPGRMEDAVRIITSRSFCVQCHRVGDFTPEGLVRSQAPRLDQVHRRLRPDFLTRWIASPTRLLPYTVMPKNFDPAKPLDPNTIVGNKGKLITEGQHAEYVEAVADLLLNFDQYTKSQISIRKMVPPPLAVPPAAGGD